MHSLKGQTFQAVAGEAWFGIGPSNANPMYIQG